MALPIIVRLSSGFHNKNQRYRMIDKILIPLLFCKCPPKILITLTVAKLEEELEAPEAALGKPPSGSFSILSLRTAS